MEEPRGDAGCASRIADGKPGTRGGGGDIEATCHNLTRLTTTRPRPNVEKGFMLGCSTSLICTIFMLR